MPGLALLSSTRGLLLVKGSFLFPLSSAGNGPVPIALHLLNSGKCSLLQEGGSLLDFLFPSSFSSFENRQKRHFSHLSKNIEKWRFTGTYF
jgi:hypothetical protein